MHTTRDPRDSLTNVVTWVTHYKHKSSGAVFSSVGVLDSLLAYPLVCKHFRVRVRFQKGGWANDRSFSNDQATSDLSDVPPWWDSKAKMRYLVSVLVVFLYILLLYFCLLSSYIIYCMSALSWKKNPSSITSPEVSSFLHPKWKSTNRGSHTVGFEFGTTMKRTSLVHDCLSWRDDISLCKQLV